MGNSQSSVKQESNGQRVIVGEAGEMTHVQEPAHAHTRLARLALSSWDAGLYGLIHTGFWSGPHTRMYLNTFVAFRDGPYPS